MVTRIASRKLSQESSTRSAHAGELSSLKKENEKMKRLVETFESLKIALEDENSMLKQRDKEKEEIIAKMIKKHEDTERVIENLRTLVEDDEKQVSDLKNRVKGLEIEAKRKDESIAKVLEETKKLGVIFKKMVAKSKKNLSIIQEGTCHFWGRTFATSSAGRRS